VLIAIGLPWVRRRMERPAAEPADGDPAPATDAPAFGPARDPG
jgi:hypothetical protein